MNWMARSLRLTRTVSASLCVVAGFMALLKLAAQTSSSHIYYFPKPVKPVPYLSPMKPLIHIAELRARHKGQANWRETVVEDFYNRVEVISSAPGSKVPPYLHADSPEYWYVEEGTIRFSIEDPPGTPQIIEAHKGSLVFAPERMLHSLEVVGNEPAIRVQVTLREARDIYFTQPAEAPPGEHFIPVKVSTNANPFDVPSPGGKPDRLYFNLSEMQQEHHAERHWEDLVIMKNRAHANIICGYAADVKHVAGDPGHLHDFPEIWVIMQGQLQYTIEGVPPFIASAGDIVYAPSTRWHRAEPYGDGPACRLAMTPFPDGNHLFDGSAAK